MYQVVTREFVQSRVRMWIQKPKRVMIKYVVEDTIIKFAE